MKPERVFVAALIMLAAFVAGYALLVPLSHKLDATIKPEPVLNLSGRDREIALCRTLGGQPVMGFNYTVVCVKPLEIETK